MKRCSLSSHLHVLALNLATFSLASSFDNTMLVPPAKNSAILPLVK